MRQMITASECPPAETLALLPDGRASRKVRLALMAHLDTCAQCRMVMAYTGQYEASRDPEPIVRVDTRWWQFLKAAPRLSLAFGVLLAAALSTPFITAWLHNPAPGFGHLSPDAIVSPLFENRTVSSYSDQRWTGHTNSFLFGSGPTRGQLAFRIGVQEVDFRVALEEGRREDASAALRTLRSLSRAAGDRALFSERWSAMEEALFGSASKERFVEELGLLDEELYAAFDPVALDLGRWTEAGRLAAASHHTRYFADPYFRAVLAELAELGVSQPVEQALDAIRTNTSPTPSEIDLAELEKGFRHLILLH